MNAYFCPLSPCNIPGSASDRRPAPIPTDNPHVRAEREFGPMARRLQALGHPTSLRAIVLLAAGELHVNAIQQALDEPLVAVSRHLRRMAQQGILRSRHAGNRMYYAIGAPWVMAMLSHIQQGYPLPAD